MQKGMWEQHKHKHTQYKFIKYLRPTVMIIDDHIFLQKRESNTRFDCETVVHLMIIASILTVFYCDALYVEATNLYFGRGLRVEK